MREAVGPDFPVGIRLSQTKVNDLDYRWPGGAAEAGTIFRAVADAGADYLHLASEGRDWLDTATLDTGATVTASAREGCRLYKTECIRDGSPFRRGPIHTLADLEEITSAWVHWYNTRRLMHRLGRIPPAEAEAAFYAATDAATPAASHTN